MRILFAVTGSMAIYALTRRDDTNQRAASSKVTPTKAG
jgi:hypothetical protein